MDHAFLDVVDVKRKELVFQVYEDDDFDPSADAYSLGNHNFGRAGQAHFERVETKGLR